MIFDFFRAHAWQVCYALIFMTTLARLSITTIIRSTPPRKLFTVAPAKAQPPALTPRLSLTSVQLQASLDAINDRACKRAGINPHTRGTDRYYTYAASYARGKHSRTCSEWGGL